MDTSGLVGELQLLNFRQNIFCIELCVRVEWGMGKGIPSLERRELPQRGSGGASAARIGLCGVFEVHRTLLV